MIERLRTDRLLIRPLDPSDVGHLMELDGDAEVMRFITGKASTQTQVEDELTDCLGTRWLVFDAAATFHRTFHLDFDDPLPGTELGEVEYDVSRETWLAR